MTWLLHRVIAIAWALWFGGLIVLFLSVTSVFDTLAPDRHAAGNITAPIFHRFEQYQLIVGALLVAAAVASRLRVAARARTLFLGLTLGAAALAVANTVVITPQIDRGRESGQTGTLEFKRAHGLSMTLFLGETVLLLAAGLALPSVLATDGVRDEQDVVPTEPSAIPQRAT